MMRIERMQEQLQLPQQLNNESREFLGVRRIESFVAQPRKMSSSPRLSVPSASSRPRHAAAKLLP